MTGSSWQREKGSKYLAPSENLIQTSSCYVFYVEGFVPFRYWGQFLFVPIFHNDFLSFLYRCHRYYSSSFVNLELACIIVCSPETLPTIRIQGYAPATEMLTLPALLLWNRYCFPHFRIAYAYTSSYCFLPYLFHPCYYFKIEASRKSLHLLGKYKICILLRCIHVNMKNWMPIENYKTYHKEWSLW